jgi:hypothetical protein
MKQETANDIEDLAFEVANQLTDHDNIHSVVVTVVTSDGAIAMLSMGDTQQSQRVADILADTFDRMLDKISAEADKMLHAPLNEVIH